MNLTHLTKLSKLATNELRRKPTILIEPGEFHLNGIAENLNFDFDTEKWIIPDELLDFIRQLSNNNKTLEENIMEVYKKICETYIYDDNVLSYLKRIDDDTFELPDEYGRIPSNEFKENRKLHNKRVCYEVARILAKSLIELLKSYNAIKNSDICILYDEPKTHYSVGMINDNYCLMLDVDDFNKIKDLTRIKMDLTANGITILNDPSNLFSPVLNDFNKSRNSGVKDYVDSFIDDTSPESNEDEIMYLKKVVEVIKEQHSDLDSAGMFEVLKEIINISFGAQVRENVWKQESLDSNNDKRYARCMIVTFGDKKYFIDVTEKDMSNIIQEYDPKNPSHSVIPVKKFDRSWDQDPSSGR